MSMPKGKTIPRGYATIIEEDGTNYRIIAAAMQEKGYKMNHTSVRNYILRTMKKFARAFAKARGEHMTSKQLDAVARFPKFQSIIADLIQRA